jgi:hypothetical protein
MPSVGGDEHKPGQWAGIGPIAGGDTVSRSL